MKNQSNQFIPSVNFHLWQPCNMRCGFCFATFQDVKKSILPKGHLPKEQALEVIRKLADYGYQKISFAGGEPTLCPWLVELIETAKSLGMTTMLVTNGANLLQMLHQLNGILDWVSISIDSLNSETNFKSGRFVNFKPNVLGKFEFVKSNRVINDSVLAFEYMVREHHSATYPKVGFDELLYGHILDEVISHGFRLKINTVVHALNCDEDFTEFMNLWKPERWKIFQVLPVAGQNETRIAEFSITKTRFNEFLERHENLNGIIDIVPEDNDYMKGSYVMVDPAGRFFDNVSGSHTYSSPILEVGVEKALSQVKLSVEKFQQRGGIYNW